MSARTASAWTLSLGAGVVFVAAAVARGRPDPDFFSTVAHEAFVAAAAGPIGNPNIIVYSDLFPQQSNGSAPNTLERLSVWVSALSPPNAAAFGHAEMQSSLSAEFGRLRARADANHVCDRAEPISPGAIPGQLPVSEARLYSIADTTDTFVASTGTVIYRKVFTSSLSVSPNVAWPFTWGYAGAEASHTFTRQNGSLLSMAQASSCAYIGTSSFPGHTLATCVPVPSTTLMGTFRVPAGTVFKVSGHLGAVVYSTDFHCIANASNTATLDIWTTDPGITIVGASGHSYAPAPCAPAPTIDQHPQPVMFCGTEPVSMSLAGTGPGPYVYVWKYQATNGSLVEIVDGLNTEPSTGMVIEAGFSLEPTLWIANFDPGSRPGGVVSIVGQVINACGTTSSNAATLTRGTGPNPTITQHPPDQSILAGAPLTLAPGVSGIGPLTWVWERNDTELTQFNNSPILSIPHATIGDMGRYEFTVRNNSCGVATSESILVIVDPPVGGTGGGVYAVNLAAPLLHRMDGGTGRVINSKRITLAGGGSVFGGTSLAVDPTSGIAYAVLQTDLPSGQEWQLATIDLTTAVATLVGPLGDFVDSIGFGTSGILYGASGAFTITGSTLFTINKTTGARTQIMVFPNSTYGDALAFSPDDGRLYHTTGGPASPNPTPVLEAIDLVSLATTSVPRSGYTTGTDGYVSQVTGLTYVGGGRFYAVNADNQVLAMTTGGVCSLIGATGLNTYWLGGLVASQSGACCTGGACSIITRPACGGVFQGEGSLCGPAGNPTTCCPANFDGVGGVTVTDIFAFLTAWFAGNPNADFNGSGGAPTVTDIFAFLTAWFGGCP